MLEEQLATLEGVKTITSSSREQGSVITVEFELTRDVDEAANDVRDRVSRVRGQLPREADDPIVAKVDVNAQPIIWLALSSERHNGLELSRRRRPRSQGRLQRLPGVGSVFIGGERRYAMRVWLDPQRLAAHGLTTQDVERRIRAENAEIPGGRVEGHGARVRGAHARRAGDARGVRARSSSPSTGDDVVRLGDVAEVEVGAEDERTVARYNGAAGRRARHRQAAEGQHARRGRQRAQARCPSCRRSLPAGHEARRRLRLLDLHPGLDPRGVATRSSSRSCLVVLVIFVFLKSLRATLIPAVAIPVSIIGTFAVAYFLGFTINILTLLALVLAIGLVVDDAIVVLENVYRHMEMGKPRHAARPSTARRRSASRCSPPRSRWSRCSCRWRS